MDRKSVMQIRHWQAPAIGLLGLWFAVSPWVIGLSGGDTLIAANVALGLALVATAAAMAHPTKSAWGAWLAVVMGLLVAASPWVLGYSEQTTATASALATGLVSGILGFMVGFTTGLKSDPDSWWDDRVAH